MDTNSKFNGHLDRLRSGSDKASKILETISKSLVSADDCLTHAWQLLFDCLCLENEPLDLSSLNTLSGIIQKLMSSHNQSQALVLKKQEAALKEEAHKAKMEQLENSLNNAKSSDGLSPEALAKIEEALNLL
tara:strand:+ start:916 stop:1311 length:396 start_codon:yes stop_codon:yes gene_type:complete